MFQKLRWAVVLSSVFAAGFLARGIVPGGAVVSAQAAARVYELRTYVVPDDKLAALNTRFRDHTMRIFQRHGIASVAYFTPQDPAKATNTLVYLIAHPSREAATRNWDQFRADAEWQKVAAASGVPRPTITSEFLVATDYSPMK
jgi:hypothetical protein